MKYVILAIVVFWAIILNAPYRFGDYLYHPFYGKYPARVFYTPGMTLYPEQVAIVPIKKGQET